MTDISELAMAVAVEMELQAAIGTKTKDKAEWLENGLLAYMRELEARVSHYETAIADAKARAVGRNIAGIERRETVALTTPQGSGAHPDDEAVDRFAAAMKVKLAQKRAEGRGGWEDRGQCSTEFLSQLLAEHVAKGDPLDVGNLAMMLHQRGDRIVARPPVSAQGVRAQALEEAAQYILKRADDFEANVLAGNVSRMLGRVYRDEATAIRALANVQSERTDAMSESKSLPVYSAREMLEMCRMLIRAQIREERINSYEELHGFLRNIDAILNGDKK